jgi:hypothetical protein
MAAENDKAEAEATARTLADLSDADRQRIALEEQLKSLSKPSVRPWLLKWWAVAIVVTFSLGVATWTLYSHSSFDDTLPLILFPPGVLVYFAIIFFLLQMTRRNRRRTLELKLATSITSQKNEQLQENLDQNFFTNLVKINFKYIDQYYLQTQLQANKSFMLCAIAALTSLFVILSGVALLFIRQGTKEAGYVATSAGAMGEFIAAVFFYLYNRTILKMGEYHQKLVLTQNVSLALKISEELPAAEQVTARSKLIDYLSKDINLFLTAKASEAPDAPKKT